MQLLPYKKKCSVQVKRAEIVKIFSNTSHKAFRNCIYQEFFCVGELHTHKQTNKHTHRRFPTLLLPPCSSYVPRICMRYRQALPASVPIGK